MWSSPTIASSLGVIHKPHHVLLHSSFSQNEVHQVAPLLDDVAGHCVFCSLALQLRPTTFLQMRLEGVQHRVLHFSANRAQGPAPYLASCRALLGFSSLSLECTKRALSQLWRLDKTGCFSTSLFIHCTSSLKSSLLSATSHRASSISWIKSNASCLGICGQPPQSSSGKRPRLGCETWRLPFFHDTSQPKMSISRPIGTIGSTLASEATIEPPAVMWRWTLRPSASATSTSFMLMSCSKDFVGLSGCVAPLSIKPFGHSVCDADPAWRSLGSSIELEDEKEPHSYYLHPFQNLRKH